MAAAQKGWMKDLVFAITFAMRRCQEVLTDAQMRLTCKKLQQTGGIRHLLMRCLALQVLQALRCASRMG